MPTRVVWLSAEADRRDEWNPHLSPKREHVREEGADVCVYADERQCDRRPQLPSRQGTGGCEIDARARSHRESARRTAIARTTTTTCVGNGE